MKIKFLIGVVFLALTAAFGQTNSLTTALQQGLFEEEANRNLDAAISNYQWLATQFDRDRQVAATAIFRLGECYRAQGKTNDAVAQYQRIIREFGDQPTLVNLSRQNLAGLGVSSQPRFQERLQAIVSKNPTGASVSADGGAVLDNLESQRALLAAQLEQARQETNNEIIAELFNDNKDLAENLRMELAMDTPEQAGLREAEASGLPERVKDAERILKEHEQAVEKARQQILDFQEIRLKSLESAIQQARAGQTMSASGVAPALGDEDQEIQRIQTMIQNSPDLINAPDEHGHTPLEKAAINGWLKVAAFLLDHGADVNAGKVSALNQAANAGNRAMVEFLLGRGADINAKAWHGKTPLGTAVEEGFQAVTEVLLANKADVNARDDSGLTPLALAAEHNQPKILQMLLAAGADANVEDNGGRTPLSFAAWSGSPEMVKQLLAAKADPNGGTLDAPLLCAINKKDAASAQLLLQAGANPNAKGELDWQPSWGFGQSVYPNNNRGWATPLWLAIDMNQLPMVQLLLKFKADPNNSQTDGRPLLFSALSHTNVLEVLLDAGAKVDASDETDFINNQTIKRTLLDTAVGQNHVVAVEMLLKHGANPNLPDARGDAPLHWAAFELADEKIFSLLLDYKANPNVRDNDGSTPLELVKRALQNNYWSGRFGNPSGGQNVPAEQKELVGKLIALLRQYGALDILPDWDRITVSRPSPRYSAAILYKGTNDWNHFTLFDLLGVQYDLLTASAASAGRGSRLRVAPYGAGSSGMENSLTFPDFTRIIIHRPSATGTNWQDLKINLVRSFDSGDCAGDVPLQFGDVVEIPEADHVINEPWPGLSTNELFTLKNCLTRHLKITVNGQTTNMIVAPQVEEIMPGSFDYVRYRRMISPSGSVQPMISLLEFEPFMLWPVLDNSKLLLASSDLSRVTVKRRDAATGKPRAWTVDCSNPNSPPNFWLRDGDVIEVPEKP